MSLILDRFPKRLESITPLDLLTLTLALHEFSPAHFRPVGVKTVFRKGQRGGQTFPQLTPCHRLAKRREDTKVKGLCVIDPLILQKNTKPVFYQQRKQMPLSASS